MSDNDFNVRHFGYALELFLCSSDVDARTKIQVIEFYLDEQLEEKSKIIEIAKRFGFRYDETFNFFEVAQYSASKIAIILFSWGGLIADRSFFFG